MRVQEDDAVPAVETVSLINSDTDFFVYIRVESVCHALIDCLIRWGEYPDDVPARAHYLLVPRTGLESRFSEGH